MDGGKKSEGSQRVLVPGPLLPTVLQQMHYQSHAGREALCLTVSQYLLAPKLRAEGLQVVRACLICQPNNSHCNKSAPPAHLPLHMEGPTLKWQVDFSEFPSAQGYKYLLVSVCKFAGWVEWYPSRWAIALAVDKVQLKDIIPRWGLPKSLESDNGPQFISWVVQHLAQALNITWKLHTPWRPQASGLVERTNGILRKQLAKICQETRLKWPDALPISHTDQGFAPGEGEV